MCTQDSTFKSLINGLSVPTWEEISLVTVAIQLMEDEEIKKIYCQHFSADEYEEETSLSHSMVCKLASSSPLLLRLPDILEAKFASCFKWIRDQYFKWIKLVKKEIPMLNNAFPKDINFITHIVNSIKWNFDVIDIEKSMHQLFSLKNITDDAILEKMFIMASRYCLEDDLKMLWEKMSDAKKKEMLLNLEFGISKMDFSAIYWICKIKGDMTKFMKFAKDVPNYEKSTDYYETVMNCKDPNVCALVLHIFKGNSSGVKCFIELAKVDIELLVHFIKVFLKDIKRNWDVFGGYWKSIVKNGGKLHLLLRRIEDENILKDIFYDFKEAFLTLSVKSWQWHKFFFQLLEIFAKSIDEVLLYDLINELLDSDVNVMKRADIFKVKMIWENMPNKVKKSFCSYISNEQNSARDVHSLWKNMTVEIFDLFLKDEELRNILTPYENYGVKGCIYASRYDLIDYWLQKCLVSEEAIISYFKNLLSTKFDAVIYNSQGHWQFFDLKNLYQFLDWAFKYENLMSRDEIFKVKDEAINENIVECMSIGLFDEDWEYFKYIIDWIVRNQNHEYENELVSWKQKVMRKTFLRRPLGFTSSGFKNSLGAFLKYGVNDFEKIKVMMSEVDVNEVGICRVYLKSDFALIDSYLSFLEGWGKDIFLIKESIFVNYVFNNYNEKDFENKRYCENIRKLLYWNCKNDQEMKTKVEEIKKTIINNYALKSIVRCLNRELDVAMNNILQFLFEGKMENEEWSKMLFDLKMKAIKNLNGFRGFESWEKMILCNNEVKLINWGKGYENV